MGAKALAAAERSYGSSVAAGRRGGQCGHRISGRPVALSPWRRLRVSYGCGGYAASGGTACVAGSATPFVRFHRFFGKRQSRRPMARRIKEGRQPIASGAASDSHALQIRCPCQRCYSGSWKPPLRAYIPNSPGILPDSTPFTAVVRVKSACDGVT